MKCQVCLHLNYKKASFGGRETTSHSSSKTHIEPCENLPAGKRAWCPCEMHNQEVSCGSVAVCLPKVFLKITLKHSHSLSNPKVFCCFFLKPHAKVWCNSNQHSHFFYMRIATSRARFVFLLKPFEGSLSPCKLFFLYMSSGFALIYWPLIGAIVKLRIWFFVFF